MDKETFSGRIISIQPRIRLTRSFDEASHSYLGYGIKLEGKHQFKVTDEISGECLAVSDPVREPGCRWRLS